MLNRIIDHMISKQERKLGAPLDYLREIAGESRAALIKLALAMPLTRHREVLPKTVYHLASVVTTQHEDCGECLKITVLAAMNDDVPGHYLRATLDGNYHLLPTPLEEVCLFAKALARGEDSTELRESLRTRYGAKGLVELGLVIAGARMFPTLKKAMGAASACPAEPHNFQFI